MTAEELRQRRFSRTTQRCYRNSWSAWKSWCEGHGVDPLSATGDDVAAWYAALVSDGNTRWTITSWRSGVRHHFASRGLADPTRDRPAVEAWAGVLRTLPRVRRQAKPLLTADVEKMVQWLERKGGLRADRDAALIGLGFAAALRGGELSALDIGDVEMVDDRRMLVTIRRSKTDQHGDGQTVPVLGDIGGTINPVGRLRAWVSLVARDTGPLFPAMAPYGHQTLDRSRRLGYEGVLNVVRDAARGAAIDGLVTPHSLRAGFCTSAARAGARPDQIMRVTRHTRVETVMGYIRDADLWTAHPAIGVTA